MRCAHGCAAMCGPGGVRALGGGDASGIHGEGPTQGWGGQGTRGAHVEHVLHGRDLGRVEVERLVEHRAHHEHAVHIRDLGRVPIGNVRIEILQVIEELVHVGDGRDVPLGDGAVRCNSGSRVAVVRLDRRLQRGLRREGVGVGPRRRRRRGRRGARRRRRRRGQRGARWWRRGRRRRRARRRRRRCQANDLIGSERPATQVGLGEGGLGEVDGGGARLGRGSDIRVAQVGVGEVGLSEVDGGEAALGGVHAVGSERPATQVGVREGGLGEVDGGAVHAVGSERRAAQVGSEVGLGEVDGDFTDPAALGSERRATQVGVSEVGLSEVDNGAIAAIGSERRAAQVGVGEAGSVQPDRPRCLERGVLEVAVRQVRPAQVELLVVLAERASPRCTAGPAAAARAARAARKPRGCIQKGKPPGSTGLGTAAAGWGTAEAAMAARGSVAAATATAARGSAVAVTARAARAARGSAVAVTVTAARAAAATAAARAIAAAARAMPDSGGDGRGARPGATDEQLVGGGQGGCALPRVARRACVRCGVRGRGATAVQAAWTGRVRLKALGARARAERTSNICFMFVTLDVSKLSGWLNADALCRVERRACGAGRGIRPGRREGVGCRRRKRHAWGLKAGAQGTRGAHVEHVLHGRDLGRVEAERLVEHRRGLPRRKAGMRCGKRYTAREA
eukprot:scaffold32656_cov108-Phaeocystis_antarctica.AAC.2